MNAKAMFVYGLIFIEIIKGSYYHHKNISGIV